MMQHSPFASPLLPTGKGLFNLAGGFRGRRPRSTTRAGEATLLIDETLNFFVKATGKDEASMRQQLTSQKREELRRSRDHWKARAEDEERFEKRGKRKRGGSSKDSLDSNERQGRSSRRNSPVRSGTHRATTEESERRWCKSGRVKCKGSSNLRSGGTKPGRERKWNRKKIRGSRIPVPMPLLAPEK